MAVKVPRFDSNRFNKVSDNKYIGTELDLNTKIYRYTDLKEIFSMLKEGKFRLSKRKTYSDRWELGDDDLQSMDKMLTVGAVYDPQKSENNKKYRRELAELLSTCFTLNDDENYCMWKSFAPAETGVRYSSTIGNFLNGIDTGGYEVYADAMYYTKFDVGVNNPRFLFTKNNCYSTEQEIRLYFIKEDGKKADDDHVFVDMNETPVIQDILLSPFIGDNNMKRWLLKSLRAEFQGLDINHSSIRIK